MIIPERNVPKMDFSRVATEGSQKFSHQISITSQSGVGGTTLVDLLRSKFHDLPYRYVSGGAIMRSKAAQLRMSIEAFAKHNREHPEDRHDEACDQMMASFATQNFMIGEGRLPHVFMPSAFHVLLVCNLKVRALRRVKNIHETLDEGMELLADRDRNDEERYSILYPKSLWPASDFDLRIDTHELSKDQVAEMVVQVHSAWRRKTTVQIEDVSMSKF